MAIPDVPGYLVDWDAAAANINAGSPTDNDPVANWNDQGGVVNWNLAGSGAEQPTWIESAINGLPAVRFDGSGNQLQSSMGVFTEDSIYWVIVFRFISTAGGPCLLTVRNNGSTYQSISMTDQMWLRIAGAVPWNQGVNSSNVSGGGAPIFDTTYKIAVFANSNRAANNVIIGGTDSDYPFISGSKGFSANSPDNNICIGSRRGDFFANIEVARIIGFNQHLAPVDLNAVGNELATAYSLTWDDISDIWESGALSASDAGVSVETYDGSGQVVHPDVIKFQTPWNGYSLWMAMTPYPGSDETFENPSVVVATDANGFTWAPPPGLTNPITPTPATGHHADTDLFYDSDSDQLWLFYINNDTGTETRFIRRTSSDGVIWNAEEDLFTVDETVNFEVSPAVVKQNGTYVMLTIVTAPGPTGGCKSASGNQLGYRTSSDGTTWSAWNPCTVNSYGTQNPWHIDVIWSEPQGRWVCLLTAYDNGFECNNRSKVFYGESLDLVDWTLYMDKPLCGSAHSAIGNDYDTIITYRSTGLIEDGLFKIWQNGLGIGTVWKVGYSETTYTDVLDRLGVPINVPPPSGRVVVVSGLTSGFPDASLRLYKQDDFVFPVDTQPLQEQPSGEYLAGFDALPAGIYKCNVIRNNVTIDTGWVYTDAADVLYYMEASRELASASAGVWHVELTINTDGAADEYTASWKKDNRWVREDADASARIANPTVRAIKRSDGTELFAATAMSQAGSEYVYKHDEATSRIGTETVLVEVAATIDGVPQTDQVIYTP